MKQIPGSEVHTKWFDDVNLPPQAALDAIINFLRSTSQPTMMGYIASEIGWSLGQTQAMLRELSKRGQVRELTDDDKTHRKLILHCNYWELV